jgi:hypothetical protein
VPSLTSNLPSLIDLLVNLTILGGGLAAAYKFRVFDVLAHRYRSEVWCTSTPVSEPEPGRFLFVGNFVIHNTGDRPLRVTRVRLSLLKPSPDDTIIDSERTKEVVAREFGSDAGTSWFQIRAGERSIFPLRVYLDELSGPLIFQCDFRWKHRGQPSEFAWLYDPRLPMTWWSEPTPGLPDAYDPSAETSGSLPRDA